MYYSAPFQALLLFILSACASGILSGIKTVLGFYQGQNTDHALDGNGKMRETIERAVVVWQKPGFFESLSLGRFLLDGTAILSLVVYLQPIFPGRLFLVGAISMLVSFGVSHWMFPMLAQAFSPTLGRPALTLYRLYSFFFMGKLGELLFKAHELALKRLGIDPKLSFLGETSLQKLASPIDEANQDRSGLEDDEKEMVRSIFELRDTQVKEIMTPRVEVAALEATAGYHEVLSLVAKEKYSRIPIYKDSIDNIIGIFHVMDLMSVRIGNHEVGFQLAEYMREAYFVPRTKKIGELLREFRQKRIHMAVVVDEYGGTSGIITLEDILEEIVGEIHDEDETETLRIRKVEPGVYIIDPIVSLSQVNEELEINLKPDDPDIQIDTLGGFILFIHGKVPEKGDTIRFKDFTFEVMEVDGQKMEKIRLLMPSLVSAAKA